MRGVSNWDDPGAGAKNLPDKRGGARKTSGESQRIEETKERAYDSNLIGAGVVREHSFFIRVHPDQVVNLDFEY